MSSNSRIWTVLTLCTAGHILAIRIVLASVWPTEKERGPDRSCAVLCSTVHRTGIQIICLGDQLISPSCFFLSVVKSHQSEPNGWACLVGFALRSQRSAVTHIPSSGPQLCKF